MNYAKPEIMIVGKADRIFEQTCAKDTVGVLEVPYPCARFNPAYDLDE